MKGEGSPIRRPRVLAERGVRAMHDIESFTIAGTFAARSLVSATLFPELAIQRSILDRLRHMLRANGGRIGKVCDSAGNLQYPVICPGAELELGHGHAQQLLARQNRVCSAA